MQDLKTNMLAFIEAHTDEMVRMLSRWVKTPSIAVFAPENDEPFGAPCAEMLRTALADAEKMGFQVRNFDNYIGTVNLSGNPPALGVAGHLDVVPAESVGWEHDPWGGEIVDGKVYGRGASDNKSACVSALYALLAYKTFYPDGKNIRIYLGCCEEFGMHDFDYYVGRYEKKNELPRTIVPDAGSAVVYGQYGGLSAAFTFENCVGDGKGAEILSLKSGGIHTVPGDGAALVRGVTSRDVGDCGITDCEIELSDTNSGLLIRATGKACHPSYPDGGKNAARALIKVLLTLPLCKKQKDALFALDTLYACEGLKAQTDTGSMTFTLVGLELTDGTLTALHNSRIGTQELFDRTGVYIHDRLKKAGFHINITQQYPPYSVDPDSDFVRRLIRVKTEFEGQPPKAIVTRSATYAGKFATAVAYGHYSANKAHQKDEYIPVDSVVRAAKMMALSMVEFGARREQ